MNSYPLRGEIWWISLDPTKGSEIKKTRPCLVLSKDEYNKAASTITIIPITSGNARYPAWEVEVGKNEGLTISHLVLPQIRVAAKERLQTRIGKIDHRLFSEIEEKLFIYLGFLNPGAISGTVGGTGITMGGGAFTTTTFSAGSLSGSTFP